MTLVEADGNYVKPYIVRDIDIYSGESYSVLIKTKKQRSSNFWLSVGVRGRKPATPPALAILSYKPSLDYILPKPRPPVTPRWNDFAHSKSFTYKLRSRRKTLKNHALTANRRIELLNTQNTINGNYLKWAINNVSLVLPPTPYLGSLKHRLKGTFDANSPPETFPKHYDIMAPAQNPNTTQSSNIYTLEFNRTVDVILQNANALAANESEVHPWHLHGHDFWVLGYGDGKFQKEKDIPRFNLKNPPLKNTVVVFPYGWTAIRFVADNPGVWAFHCHIEPHLHMGMGVVVAEGIELLGDVPKEALACGKTGTEMMNTTFANP